MRELPCAINPPQDSRSAAFAITCRIERLVEPRDISMHDDVAMARREGPRFSLGKVRMSEAAERLAIPALLRIGAEKNELRGHGTEVAFFVCGGRRSMPVIDDAVYG